MRFAIFVQIIIDLGVAQRSAATITGNTISFHVDGLVRRQCRIFTFYL